MTEYFPDNWVILKINDDNPHYRVLAGWSGDGDSWCMNSRITRAEDAGDRFNFYGSSGSCYSCHKEIYTLRMNNSPIWAKLQELLCQIILAENDDLVEMMPEDTDWLNMDWIIK